MADAPITGPHMGTVIKREKDPVDDPEAANRKMEGRVKLNVPGLIDESAWAWPLNFGGAQWFGYNRVPPLGAMCAVWKVNNDIDRLVYIPASHGEGQHFPEFVHPDIEVGGDQNFRFVRDKREGQQYAAFQVIKEVAGVEELICETRYDIENNAMRIFATTGLMIETLGQLTIDAVGQIKIGGRILERKPGTL